MRGALHQHDTVRNCEPVYAMSDVCQPTRLSRRMYLFVARATNKLNLPSTSASSFCKRRAPLLTDRHLRRTCSKLLVAARSTSQTIVCHHMPRSLSLLLVQIQSKDTGPFRKLNRQDLRSRKRMWSAHHTYQNPGASMCVKHLSCLTAQAMFSRCSWKGIIDA